MTPPQLIDIKAIQGDSSDNIPGVPGIGEKGARELISKYGSLDGVYEHIDDPDIKAGMRKKLEEGKDSAYLSRWLGTVQLDAPVETDGAAYSIRPMDVHRIRTLMTDLELFSLLKRMQLPEESAADIAAPEKPSDAPSCVKITFGDAEGCIADAKERGRADFVWGDGTVAHCTANSVTLMNGEEGDKYLYALCGDDSIKKRTHDLKALTHTLRCIDVAPCGFVMDTMLAAYLVNPSANDYSLERLCESYLGADSAPLPPFVESAAQAVRFTALCDLLAVTLEEKGMSALLRDIELPLAIVLADMEDAGFAVDRNSIEQFGVELDERVA
ncbi:MAG: DNA polymerase I, partial [Clostridia bacterium]|nr:DNA polymerase I [Clostridia bacterium]